MIDIETEGDMREVPLSLLEGCFNILLQLPGAQSYRLLRQIEEVAPELFQGPPQPES